MENMKLKFSLPIPFSVRMSSSPPGKQAEWTWTVGRDERTLSVMMDRSGRINVQLFPPLHYREHGNSKKKEEVKTQHALALIFLPSATRAKSTNFSRYWNHIYPQRRTAHTNIHHHDINFIDYEVN